MSYCPIIKKDCPKNHDKCEFWEEPEINARDTCPIRSSCEFAPVDCDKCLCINKTPFVGNCSLKINVKQKLFEPYIKDIDYENRYIIVSAKNKNDAIEIVRKLFK